MLWIIWAAFGFRRQTSRRRCILSDMNLTSYTPDLRPLDKADESRLHELGFRWGDKGTHTSRTIMLDELQAVLGSVHPAATREEYLVAIHDDNCLGKRTAATRKLSSQRLTELYGLDPAVPLFRILRRLWTVDSKGQAILALLLALARDPLLRASANPILRMNAGDELARQQVTDAIAHTVGSRLSESTIDKVVRNAASSWTQAGHLRGRGRKIRQPVSSTAATAAYALLLGYLVGIRGAGLFQSLWARVLDSPVSELTNLAVDARRIGLLDLSQAGGVIDISFSRLLSSEETG